MITQYDDVRDENRLMTYTNHDLVSLYNKLKRMREHESPLGYAIFEQLEVNRMVDLADVSTSEFHEIIGFEP